jgi:hypothetical protein
VIGIPFPITIPDTVDKYTLIISQSTGTQNVNNQHFVVKQNFPNPAFGSTVIEYNMPHAAKVEFRLFDVLGKELEAKPLTAKQGTNTIRLEARNYEPGIYMYSIKYGDAVVTRRLMIGKK